MTIKFRLALNKFADLTAEEFSKMQGLRVSTNNVTDGGNHTSDEEEDVTNATGRTLYPIRYQGTCGGCYAFSTANAMQAIYKIKKGSFLITLILRVTDH
jgi:cathepsin L